MESASSSQQGAGETPATCYGGTTLIAAVRKFFPKVMRAILNAFGIPSFTRHAKAPHAHSDFLIWAVAYQSSRRKSTSNAICALQRCGSGVGGIRRLWETKASHMKMPCREGTRDGGGGNGSNTSPTLSGCQF